MILYKIVFVYVNISINYHLFLLCIYVDINYGQIWSDYHHKEYAFYMIRPNVMTVFCKTDNNIYSYKVGDFCIKLFCLNEKEWSLLSL